MEAVQAYADGRLIRCEMSDRKYFYNGLQHNYPYEQMQSIRDNEERGGISKEEILKGKWYIDED